MKRFMYLAVLSVLWQPSGALLAQVTGSITGSVRDPSGSAVVSAPFKLINSATNAERTLATDESGDFVITALPPAEYSIHIEASGFRPFERKGIVLTASERLSVGNLVLEVGTVGDQITISEQGASVQTVSAEKSAAITGSQIEGLLIFGRSVTSLVALAPGVVDPIGAGARSMDGGSATNFNVNGNRAASNNFTVDGVTMTAVGGAPNGTFGVSMEAVAEVKILLSNYQAEYGRLSGSNVQMVTKSGAKDFHGLGLYYKRHEQFNANNFFNNRLGLEKPINRFNSLTYNIGGPVTIPGKFNRNRDKLFFFWNHEYLPRKVSSPVQSSTVPTLLERAGDFSQSIDVNGQRIPVIDPTSRTPFPGNIIPPNRLDPNGQALLKFFPEPNFFNREISRGAYNHVTQWGGQNPLQMLLLKLDYNISSADSLSFTGSAQFSRNDAPNLAQITAPFAVVQIPTSNHSGMDTIHYRRIFSPTLINEFMVGYGYTFGPPDVTPEGLQGINRSTWGFNAGALNPSNNPLNLLPGMSFGGVVGAAGLSYDGRFPFNGARNVFDLSDTVSKTLGSHVIKAGVFFERLRQRDGPWAGNFSGTFDFGANVNNPLNSGHPYANAALGVFNSYTEASSRPISRIYSRSIDWFAQDTWRVTRRLTLDYGVRFNWYEPFWNFNGQLAGFQPAFYDPSQQVELIRPAIVDGVRVGQSPVTGETYPASLIGFIAPGKGDPANGTVVTTNSPDYPRALVKNSGVLAAPRIGFAYDPFGDGKTAIRAGFGIFYNRILGVNSAAINSYPLVQTPVVQFGTLSTFRSAQGFLSPPSLIGWDRDMKTPSVMNMSFSIQRDIGFGTVLDVGYVGSLGRHLFWQRSLQDVPVGARFDPSNADPTNPRVPLPDVFLRPVRGYNNIGYNEAAGTSNYHSLQVTANRRFAYGVEFGVSYTWSKALDFADGDFGAVTTAAPFREWNYGLAGFDRTHLLKVNYLWTLPKHNWPSAVLRGGLNGWQVSGIASFISGAPVGVGYSLVNVADLSGTPSVTPRILVTGNPVLSGGEKTFSRAFRTDVFEAPAAGTLGTLSKTLLRGPGINNWDIAIFRNIAIRERVNLQLRSELYNAFNHTQFSAFDATARFDSNGRQVNGQFGQYTAANDPRIVQIALRLQF